MPSLRAAGIAALTAKLVAAQAFTGSSEISLYWGQNSYGSSSGSSEQQDLATYCQNSDVDVIPLAFLYQMTTGEGGQPVINFANSGNACSTFDGTALLHCPQIGSDIKTCQGMGKTILLSVGGATYSEGGFASEQQAVDTANQIWSIFGPDTNSSALRPFDDAVIDGFDFDFETTVQNTVPFANQLRSNMDADTSKTYYLTAAPQCPYPDAADDSMLNGGVKFDAVFVQFYNNYCGVSSYTAGSSTQNNFNFDTWDNWAKTGSANPDVKVFLGVPANTGAGAGYLDVSDLTPVIQYSQTFSSFGGVMMWDASQAWANNGFVSGVASAMGASSKVRRSHPKMFKA